MDEQDIIKYKYDNQIYNDDAGDITLNEMKQYLGQCINLG